MFPIQLMTVRKSKGGFVRSVFLTGESSDYAAEVIRLFTSSLGRKRDDIQDEVQRLELRSQNPKIVRALALLMFRLSKLDPPSRLDAPSVRKAIFQRATTPAVTPEDRISILTDIAEEFKKDPSEIESAMYADKEGEQVLSAIPSITPEDLGKIFNAEQIETVMLKSSQVTINMKTDPARLIRRIHSLGLLYDHKILPDVHKISISGPVSIMKHSERYGSRLAILMRFLFKIRNWDLEARVTLKNSGEKAEYTYHLDESVVSLLPESEPEDSVNRGKTPPMELEVGGNVVYPDYEVSINDRKIAVFFTRPHYYEEDFQLVKSAVGNGYDADLFCLLDSGEKCPSGAHCLRDEIDYGFIRTFLMEKYAAKDEKNRALAPSDMKKDLKENQVRSRDSTSPPEAVISHLAALYPDSQAMLDYLDFMGMNPTDVLEKAGYKVIWKGLRIQVSRE